MLVRFDHSYEGLLSAAAYCYRRKLDPDDLLSSLDPPSLLPAVRVSEEENIVALFRKHMCSLMAPAAAEAVLDDCRDAWYAESTGMPYKIMQYIKQAIQIRSDPSDRLYDPCIAAVSEAAQKVRRQGHHYKGLLRFKQIDESVYLADFEPDYIILPLIMPHFCDRMADQTFIIRDLKHRQAGIHLPDGRWDVFNLSTDDPADLVSWQLSKTDQERSWNTDQADIVVRDVNIYPRALSYEDLWCRYLERLAIPERINPKLQQQNMPRKYWKHLTESPDAARQKNQYDAVKQTGKGSSDQCQPNKRDPKLKHQPNEGSPKLKSEYCSLPRPDDPVSI